MQRMNALDTLEWALRSSALTSLALLAAMLLRESLRTGGHTSRALLGVLLCLGGYLLCSAGQQMCSRFALAWPLTAAALLFPFALWRLVQTALLDEPRIAPLAWLGAAGLLVAGAGATYDLGPLPLRILAFQAVKLLALGFIGHALWRLWRFSDHDVVESRRRLRRWLLGGALAYAAVVIAVELLLQGQRATPWLEVLNVALIALLMGCCLVFFMQLRSQVLGALLGWQPATKPVLSPVSSGEWEKVDAPLLPVSPVATLSAQAMKLEQLMRQERLYQEADLNLAQLAARMQLPEYQLRRLIHEECGHRNLASFVNQYRLDEVASRLCDPALDRRPILTLALEAGFGSIGPFNRSFRERYQLTPSEFRAQRKGASSQT